MSALGHKRIFAPQKGMSALPLKEDFESATRDRCLTTNRRHAPFEISFEIASLPF
jgi:hypothetical protein